MFLLVSALLHQTTNKTFYTSIIPLLSGKWIFKVPTNTNVFSVAEATLLSPFAVHVVIVAWYRLLICDIILQIAWLTDFTSLSFLKEPTLLLFKVKKFYLNQNSNLKLNSFLTVLDCNSSSTGSSWVLQQSRLR